MGKRGAATAGRPAKKAKEEAPVDPVAAALQQAEQLPERVRTLLVDILPNSLGFASDERHDIQNMAVTMVEQSLQGRMAALTEAMSNTVSHLETLKSSGSDLEKAVVDAEAALASQKDVLKTKQEASEAANTAHSEASKDLAEKQKAHDEAQEKHNTLKEESTAIEAAFAEHFAPMEEGEAKAHLKKLEPFLKKIEIEGTLLSALPSCVGKSKDKRGTFDNLVLQELDKAFKAKIASLKEEIANEGPAAAAREEGIKASQANLEAKTAAQTQATAELDQATKDLAAREEGLASAKLAVENFEPEVAKVTQQVEDAKKAVSDFETGPLATFETQKTRVAAKPESPAKPSPSPAKGSPAKSAGTPAEAEAAVEAAAEEAPAAEAAA